jgi:hypothetical protein
MPAPQRTRRDLEIISHLRTFPLNLGAPNILGKDFPLGEGWYRLIMRFNIVLTVGTASGPISEGELSIIKNIVFRTGAGEFVCNLPGRALWKIAIVKGGTPPRKDAIAAASATYSVDLPLYFTDDRMKRPEDTILDTSRYSALALEITYGTVADLFTTPGTASITANLDLEIERTKGRLPKKALPIFHIFYGAQPSQDAFVQTFVEIDRAPDVAYKRFFSHESTAGISGGVFTGTTSDAIKNLERIVDQSGDICRDRIHEQIQNMNKNDYSLEAVIAGVTVYDFVRDGSVNSALYPGDRSRLQFKWDNKAGVASGSIVSLVHEAVRGLKG